MAELEKVIKWFEYDYLPRVGAYRKDCKQGCDACMPMHDGDDYCDIDMLCKILAMLKEQETSNLYKCPNCGTWVSPENVVLCKDCKHYKRDTCSAAAGMAFPPPDDWFCADWEHAEAAR